MPLISTMSWTRADHWEWTKSPSCMRYCRRWEGRNVAGTDWLFEDDRAKVEQDDEGCGNAKVVFKPSHRGESYLLPPSLNELIGPDNLVRFVDAVVDRLDLSGLIERYKGGGVCQGSCRVAESVVTPISSLVHRIAGCFSLRSAPPPLSVSSCALLATIGSASVHGRPHRLARGSRESGSRVRSGGPQV